MDAMVRIQHSDKPYSHQMNALHVIHDRLRAGDQYLSGADKQLQTLMLGNRLDLLEPVDIFASIRDEIAAPLNSVIYKGRLKNHPSMEQRPVLEELKTFTLKTLGAAKYSLIVDVKNTETSVVPGTQSKYNPIMACVITNIVKMYTDAFPKLTIAIVTCYNAQYLLLLAIRDVMAQEDKNGKTYFISQLVKAFLSHSCKKKVLLGSPNNNGVNSLCIAARSAIRRSRKQQPHRPQREVCRAYPPCIPELDDRARVSSSSLDTASLSFDRNFKQCSSLHR
jgi:hypothetical protein